MYNIYIYVYYNQNYENRRCVCVCMSTIVYKESKVTSPSQSPKCQALQPGQWPGFQGRAMSPAMGAKGAMTTPGPP